MHVSEVCCFEAGFEKNRKKGKEISSTDNMRKVVIRDA